MISYELQVLESATSRSETEVNIRILTAGIITNLVLAKVSSLHDVFCTHVRVFNLRVLSSSSPTAPLYTPPLDQPKQGFHSAHQSNVCTLHRKAAPRGASVFRLPDQSISIP